jgi:hypothetical protein
MVGCHHGSAAIEEGNVDGIAEAEGVDCPAGLEEETFSWPQRGPA